MFSWRMVVLYGFGQIGKEMNLGAGQGTVRKGKTQGARGMQRLDKAEWEHQLGDHPWKEEFCERITRYGACGVCFLTFG